MIKDIYSSSKTLHPHSLRYIHIIAKNVVGILNRISSLMRRRRYNMDEVSVSFDSEGNAHIIIAVDAQLLDVQQVIHQIMKLHDVLDVYDATHREDKLYNGVYVQAEKESDFNNFPLEPVRIVENDNGVTGVFMITLKEAPDFFQFLSEKNFYFIHRIMSLI